MCIVGCIDVKEYQYIVPGAIITAKVRLFYRQAGAEYFPALLVKKHRRGATGVLYGVPAVITPTLSGKTVKVNGKFLIS
jgi:hypothetical protein